MTGKRRRQNCRLQWTPCFYASPHTQVSTLPPELLLEWAAELSRRLDRATALIALGLPDPGFDLLPKRFTDLIELSGHAAAPRRKAA